jgi:hypothetical protein
VKPTKVYTSRYASCSSTGRQMRPSIGIAPQVACFTPAAPEHDHMSLRNWIGSLPLLPNALPAVPGAAGRRRMLPMTTTLWSRPRSRGGTHWKILSGIPPFERFSIILIYMRFYFVSNSIYHTKSVIMN